MNAFFNSSIVSLGVQVTHRVRFTNSINRDRQTEAEVILYDKASHSLW